MHISFVHHRPSRQKYTSSSEYMQIYVYANTYAHRPHIPLSRATLLVNNAFHGEISVHDNKIREIESVTMIAHGEWHTVPDSCEHHFGKLWRRKSGEYRVRGWRKFRS